MYKVKPSYLISDMHILSYSILFQSFLFNLSYLKLYTSACNFKFNLIFFVPILEIPQALKTLLFTGILIPFTFHQKKTTQITLSVVLISLFSVSLRQLLISTTETHFCYRMARNARC